jgi:hypothetical protein
LSGFIRHDQIKKNEIPFSNLSMYSLGRSDIILTVIKNIDRMGDDSDKFLKLLE